MLTVDHVQEVEYPTWLVNVVLSPKLPTWRMCMDYIDLNEACPKDLFPLPRMDLLVDETTDVLCSNSWMHSLVTTRYSWIREGR